MVERTRYLQKLMGYQDKRLIKIITGVRRCGKSTLFLLYQRRLLAQGILAEQIHTVNFEDMQFASLCDATRLHDYLVARLLPDRMNYIFLDEIQNVPDYQRAVDSLYIRENVDLYLTGSNAYLLSGDLATLLSGRYVEIQMLPLSFGEYVSTFEDRSDLPRKYRDYLQGSAFPYALSLQGPEQVTDYLSGIYHTVLLKDVVARRSIADVSMLESVIRFMADNIGSLCSIKKISDTMTSAGRKISTHTVENYLSALEDGYILYRAGRYDIKGKQHLKTLEKYYLVDMGLRSFLLGPGHADVGHVLENVVYLELLRRGNQVAVGKVDATEVDFVTTGAQGTVYYQVAASVREAGTLQRELRPLDAIQDHYPKVLLTLDDDPEAVYNGIRQRYVLDWLLEEDA